MKPLGRKTVRFPCKIDCHPPKGYVNWWEYEINDESGNKAREKRTVTNEIFEQIKENDK